MSDAINTTCSQQDIRNQLISVLLNVQGAVSRRLATLPSNEPGQDRAEAWRVYSKDLALQRALTEALEKYA